MSNILTEFNKNFGLETNLDGEKNKFIQRINQTVFREVGNDYYPYIKVFKFLCYQLGENTDDRIVKANQYNYDKSSIPEIRSLTHDNFLETLRILILLYNFFNDDAEWKKIIDSFVLLAISSTDYNLGIRWHKGMFYPSGSKKLDDKLVDEVLGVLHEKDRKPILIAYTKGLREFLESKKDKTKLKNVIRDMQLSLDETSKLLLMDKNIGFKHLLKNKNWNEIIGNKYYQRIFEQVNEFADKLAKHKAEAEFSEHEVETFIYLTGIFIRLVFIQND